MAGAIVLPQQPSSMELIGQILKAIGGMPGQIQAGTNAAATQQAQQQQQQNMQMFQELLGKTMGMPNEVSSETVVPPQIDPNSEITEVPDGSGFAPPGMAQPQQTKTTTGPNPAKQAGMKQLKDLGPYFGVPKQGATLEELLALQGSKNEGAANVADIKGQVATTIAEGKNKSATEIARANQQGKKESLAARTAHNKEIEKILGRKTDISQQNANTAGRRVDVFGAAATSNAASAARNATTNENRAGTYAEAVASQAEHAIDQVDAFKQRTNMMKDALGTREVIAKGNVLSKMSKQLTQIYKIKEQDLTNKDNQAIYTQAAAQYEQLRQQLIAMDPDSEDQIPSLDIVSERGSTGIGDMLKQAFSGTFTGTAPAPGLQSTPAGAPKPSTNPAPDKAAIDAAKKRLGIK